MTGYWVYGATILLAVLYGVMLLYAYRNGRRAAQLFSEEDVEAYVGADRVECPDCGVANDTGYRYCRQCVSELPGSMRFGDESAPPRERRTL